ncbi:MAG: hypothetical protein HQM02_10285, partial [Magnetococcales bacterium]|nr:hypothetical protein [Magnetococcales bacterium]
MAILFALVGMCLSPGGGLAATYDATGRWSVLFTPTQPVDTSTAGCLPFRNEPFLVTIAQSGDGFTLAEYQEATVSGTVSGATYAFNNTHSDGSARNVVFTLTGENAASGSATLSRPNNIQGGTLCAASGTVVLSRAAAPLFPLTGSWSMRLEGEQLDSALSSPGCAAAPARSVEAKFLALNDSFLVGLDDLVYSVGDIDGGYRFFKVNTTGTAQETAVYHLLQTTTDSAGGTLSWARNSGGALCVGSNLFTMTRIGGGDGDPNPALAVSPMNMTVGNARPLDIHHATGIPVAAFSPPPDFATLTTTGGIATITCNGPGQANVAVTDGKSSASATITCVAASGAIGGEVAIADWIFPNNQTLVTQHLWQGSGEGARPSHSVRWSQAAGTTSYLNRGTVSLLVGEEENAFTLDGNGLTFHGGKRYDPDQNEASRFALYGFVLPPNSSFATGIHPEDVAPGNLTTPTPFLPPMISDGVVREELRIEYRLDANNAPIPDRWVVIKQDVAVRGNLDLLSATLPAELQDDRFFLDWRDAITDATLLGKLTNVMRVHLIETRYETASAVATTTSGDLYLVQGLGVVYETWNESDGISRNALVASESGGVLVSLTNRTIAARTFRIDAPAGVVLEHPFVQLRVTHADHDHEWQGSWNATPGGNSALLKLYERVNPPAWDAPSVVALTYGAKGFERQQQNDPVTTASDPVVLTLTAAQQGRQVGFTVKDGAGNAPGSARLGIHPYRNGACDLTVRIEHELAADGTATVSLTDGQHCVGLWPNDSRAFIGGYHDPAKSMGLVNIIAPGTGFTGAPLTVSASLVTVPLVVGYDDGPDRSLVTGVLTDG